MQNTKPAPFQTLKIIWGALLASCIVYVYVGTQVLLRGNPDSSRLFPDLASPMEMPLAGFAAVMFVASLILPRFLLAHLPAQVAAKKDPENVERHTFNAYFVQRIVSFALSETPVLMGVVLTTVSRSDRIIFPFFALSLAALLINRPRESEVRELARRAGASSGASY